MMNVWRKERERSERESYKQETVVKSGYVLSKIRRKRLKKETKENERNETTVSKVQRTGRIM